MVVFVVLYILDISSVNGQNRVTVNGTLTDTVNNSIPNLLIKLISGKDTLQTHSKSKGEFFFTFSYSKHISIFFESILYERLKLDYTLSKDQPSINLQTIILKEHIQRLNEIQVNGKAIAIKLKNDTIEYNAANYKVNKDARLDDLLKKLPGLIIDINGNVFIAGQQIKKLRVNGKDFFSGNLQDFLKQLPAEIILKLQIVDNYGKLAEFSGIHNDTGEKIINIVTKSNINSGTFGNLSTFGGTDKRFGLGTNANFWRDIRQYSFSGNLNTADNKSGINTSNNAQATFRYPLNDKFNVSANLNYNGYKNSIRNTANSQTVNEIGTYYTSSLNEINTYDKFISSSFELAYNSKGTYLTIAPSLKLANNNKLSHKIANLTGVINQDLTTSFLEDRKIPAINILANAGFHFKLPRRELTMSLTLDAQNAQTQQYIDDSIRYKLPDLRSVKDSSLNRRVAATDHVRTYSYNLTYSEPISQKVTVNLSYDYLQTAQSNSLITDVEGIYNSFSRVDSLSTIYNSQTINQKLALSYNYRGKKARLSSGLLFQQNTLKVDYENKYDQFKNTKMRTSPFVSMDYRFSERSDVKFKYTTNSTFPIIEQLQPLTDNRNLQNIIIGNPNLKPSFQHIVTVIYKHFNPSNNHMLFFTLNGSYNQDQIVSNVLLKIDTLNSLRQETHFLNSSGSYKLSSNYSYSIPFSLTEEQKLNIDLAGNTGYNNAIFFSNNIKNDGKTIYLYQSARLSYNKKHLDINASASYSYNRNYYTFNNRNVFVTKTFEFSTFGNFDLYEKLKLNIDFKKKYNRGFLGTTSNNPMIINLALTHHLFSKPTSSVRLQVNDLFNQGNKLQQSVTNNTVTNLRTDYVTRFFLLSVSFQLEHFGPNHR
jgi:hypothetical protein